MWNPSPITEYGTYERKLIGTRWNILTPFRTYFLQASEAGRIQLTYGEPEDKIGKKMQEDMKATIGEAPAVVVRTVQSPPAGVENRSYYP